MWKHWAIRANTPYEPFRSFENAQWIWRALQGLFPDALGAMLMPNHVHLILPSHLEIQKIHGLLGVISKRLKTSELWQPIRELDPIPDRSHLRRTVRYVALNPCRAKLCSDPLDWIWSTYRDVMGASVNPWVTDVRLSRELQERTQGFRVRFHAYTSGDPSVSIHGTPAPQPASPQYFTHEGILEILLACAAALRVHPDEIRVKNSDLRRLFVQLAYRQGWRYPKVLAHHCGVTPAGIRQIAKKTAASEQGVRRTSHATVLGVDAGNAGSIRTPFPEPLQISHPSDQLISAAALCLGDRRLVKRMPAVKK